MSKSFVGAFWEGDCTSQTGFDALFAHMKSGRNTCKEFEEYLKQRAKVEEEYGKALMKIAKVERGNAEVGTIRRSFEEFRNNAEAEANARLELYSVLVEEANKLSAFREQQKEETKSHEEFVRKIHKTKSDHFRKMNTNKTSYENKCKASEKADSDLERMKFNNKPKEVDKARKNAMTCQQNKEKADNEYKNSVQLLEASRLKWISDHTRACEVYEELDIERMKKLRNTIWIFTNLISDIAVGTDRNCESIRNSLELIDMDKDLQIVLKDKGRNFEPLKEITYIPYCDSTSQQNANVTMHTNNNIDSEYQTVNFTPRPNGNAIRYKALYAYTKQSSREIDLHLDDEVVVSIRHEDGWSEGLNKTTGHTGLFPTNYINQL